MALLTISMYHAAIKSVIQEGNLTTTTNVKNIYLISDPEILKRQYRSQSYYRVDQRIKNVRFTITVTIPATCEVKLKSEAWFKACKFKADSMGLRRTPTEWLDADPTEFGRRSWRR